MQNTTNNITKILAVGIDPAKNKHKIVGIVYPQQIVFETDISNDVKDFNMLAEQLQTTAKQHDMSEVIIGLEDVSNYGRNLCHFLLLNNFKVKEVNTMITSRQRDAFGEDKNDFKDALCCAIAVLNRFNELPDMIIPNETEQSIRDLVRYRQQLVQQKTRFLNQLHNYIYQQYPNYEKYFPNLDSLFALHFFKKYPVPQNLKNLSVTKLSNSIKTIAKSGFKKQNIPSLAKLILSDCDKTISTLQKNDAVCFIISDLSNKIIDLINSINLIEKQLKVLVSQSKYKVITSFDGINTVTASKIIGETLSVERFHNNRNKFAKFNGSAPVEVASGKTKFHKRNNRCNRLLKSTFYLLALTAYRSNPISKSFVQNKISNGYSKKQALVHLARRISDIVFAMMCNLSVYNPDFFKEPVIAA